MECALCNRPERSWNHYRKRVESKRVGEGVRSIICSPCIQQILGAGSEAYKLRRRAAEKGTPTQAEAVEKFFGKQEHAPLASKEAI